MGRTVAQLGALAVAASLALSACSEATSEATTAAATSSAWEQIKEAHFAGLEPVNAVGDSTQIQSFPLMIARDQLSELREDPARFEHHGYLFELALVDDVAPGDYSVLALPTAS